MHAHAQTTVGKIHAASSSIDRAIDAQLSTSRGALLSRFLERANLSRNVWKMFEKV
jgi:hypothetical protein